jgi:hypothetical protein
MKEKYVLIYSESNDNFGQTSHCGYYPSYEDAQAAAIKRCKVDSSYLLTNFHIFEDVEGKREAIKERNAMGMYHEEFILTFSEPIAIPNSNATYGMVQNIGTFSSYREVNDAIIEDIEENHPNAKIEWYTVEKCNIMLY